MKLRNVVAAFAAASVAASAMAVSAFANMVGTEEQGDSVQFACLVSNDWHTPVLTDTSLLDDVVGFTLTMSVDDYRTYESEIGGVSWFGGAVGTNSNSTGWANLATWGVEGGEEDIIWQATAKRGVYTLTYTQDSPIFKTTEEYAFFWIQDYSADKSFTYTFTDFVLLNADGEDVLATVADEPADEPDVDEPVVDDPVEDEPVVDDPVVDEPADGDEIEVGDGEEAAPDWDAYDADAAAANNEAYTLFNGSIDLYAILGEDLYDLATVDATFAWTAGEGWCGGSGLSGVVTEDGSAWIGGAEYGAANANAGVVDDGVVTQTVVDITGNPIVQLGVVEADGSTTYPKLELQNWWNGAEAGAELVGLTFYNADGDVIGTLGEVAADEGDTSNEADASAAPVSDKGNPDTGVAGVAAAVAVAAVAGAAVVIARKRK